MATLIQKNYGRSEVIFSLATVMPHFILISTGQYQFVPGKFVICIQNGHITMRFAIFDSDGLMRAI